MIVPSPRHEFIIDRYIYFIFYFTRVLKFMRKIVLRERRAAAAIVFPIALDLESFQTGSRIVSFSFAQYRREKYWTFVGNIVGLYYILFIKNYYFFFHVSHTPYSHADDMFFYTVHYIIFTRIISIACTLCMYTNLYVYVKYYV